MSDEKPAAKAEKPGGKAGGKGGMVGKLIGGLLLVAGAAAGGFGGGFAAMQMGGGKGGGDHGEAPAMAKAPVEYVEIDNAFTSNLIDTGRYLQIRLSVSTTGGAPVVAAIGQHKPALISAVLAVLGEAGEADVADRAAKEKLRMKLKQVVNDELQRVGVAGIDDVFFTSLVVQ